MRIPRYLQNDIESWLLVSKKGLPTKYKWADQKARTKHHIECSRRDVNSQGPLW